MTKFKQLVLLLPLVALIILGSCSKDKPHECDGGEGSGFDYCISSVELGIEGEYPFPVGGSLNVQTMLANMAAQLDGNVVGYQIAVSIDGLVRATRSYGLSKRSPDCEVGMFDCRKFNIASQSKTITVAAVLKLLEENGLTIDSPVSPHLPDDWTRTSYMDLLMFRHFLSHRTAFPGANLADPSSSDWAACKKFVESTPQQGIANDPNNPDLNTYDYKNCNLALMRIIIPTLWRNLAHAPSELRNAPKITDELCKKYYELYVQQHIFAAANVEGSLVQTTTSNVLFYEFDNNNVGREYYLDWRGHGGGGGWVMTAANVAKVMDAIANNDVVCSPANRAIMRGHPTLNWWAGFTIGANTPLGAALGHGGDLNSQGGRMSGNYAMLPGGVVVCLMVNSHGPGISGSGDLFNIIVNGFNNALTL